MTPGLVSGGGGRGAGGGDDMLFYSVCQATFYVMCFRGADIAAVDGIASHVSRYSIAKLYHGGRSSSIFIASYLGLNKPVERLTTNWLLYLLFSRCFGNVFGRETTPT